MVSSLSTVEMQLIAQFLSYQEIVEFARCDRRTLSDLSSKFVFERVKPMELMSDHSFKWRDVKIDGAISNLQRLTDRSLLRYIKGLKVTGTLKEFTSLPEEVKRAVKEIDLSQSTNEVDIEALRDTISIYRSITRVVVESFDREMCNTLVLALPQTNIVDIVLFACESPDLRPLLQSPDSLSQRRIELISLNLCLCSLETESLTLLFRALATDRTLKCLNLSGNRIPETEIRLLADALRVNTVLEDLALYSCKIEDGIVEIARALCEAGSVHSFDENVFVGRVNGADPPFDRDVDPIKGSALTSLDLTLTGISSIGAKALANLYALPGSRIRSIDLMGNSIGSEGAFAIMKALSTVGSKSQIDSSLRALDFRECSIGVEGVNALSSYIRALGESCLLESLHFNLEDDPEDDLVGFAFGDALSHNRSIKRLDLSSTNIDRRVEMTQIANALLVNRTLTEIDFRYIDLQPGMRAISKALAVNTSLTSITFVSTKITDNEASLLSDALRKNRTLLSLSLFSNKIGDIGMCAIGEALRQNSVLTSLDIFIEPECREGALSIATALDSRHSISRLRHLNLSSSHLSDEVRSVLVEISRSPSRIPSLKSFVF